MGGQTPPLHFRSKRLELAGLFLMFFCQSSMRASQTSVLTLLRRVRSSDSPLLRKSSQMTARRKYCPQMNYVRAFQRFTLIPIVAPLTDFFSLLAFRDSTQLRFCALTGLCPDPAGSALHPPRALPLDPASPLASGSSARFISRYSLSGRLLLHRGFSFCVRF